MAKREALGHMHCHECDFPDAEIKPQSKNPELLYRWCPECNAQYFARTPEATARLRAKIRTPGGSEHAKAPAIETPAHTPPPPPAQRKTSALDVFGIR